MRGFVWATVGLLTAAGAAAGQPANVVVFGDLDRVGNGTYLTSPWDTAALFGLTAGQTSAGPVFPAAGPTPPNQADFQRTDRVLKGTGSAQDGYANAMNNPLSGAHTFTLDYTAALQGGTAVDTLTIGVMLIDVQPSASAQYTLNVNGSASAFTNITGVVNGLDQAGQAGQFLSFGVPLDVLALNPSANTLNFTIDQGVGGDGFAVDFLTVGVTPVPEPAGLLLVGLAAFVPSWMSVKLRNACRG